MTALDAPVGTKMWPEKDKILVTSIFSLSHKVFYHMKDKFYMFTFNLSANSFNLDKAKSFSFGKRLTDLVEGLKSMRMTDFENKNTVGKEENAGNLHFLLFPQ